MLLQEKGSTLNGPMNAKKCSMPSRGNSHHTWSWQCQTQKNHFKSKQMHWNTWQEQSSHNWTTIGTDTWYHSSWKALPMLKRTTRYTIENYWRSLEPWPNGDTTFKDPRSPPLCSQITRIWCTTETPNVSALDRPDGSSPYQNTTSNWSIYQGPEWFNLTHSLDNLISVKRTTNPNW